MIRNKKELKFYIEADMIMNRGCSNFCLKKRLFNLIVPDYIMNFLIIMRKYSYYKNLTDLHSKILSIYYHYRYRKLSLKLGFSFAPDIFGYGLLIPHYGTIVVNHTTKAGNYCVLHNGTCIAGEDKIIGDGLYLSTGAKITGTGVYGNGVTIAANSVANKSVGDNILLAGIPAVIKREKYPIWYNRDSKIFKERVERVEILRKKLLTEVGC